jgi:hypothetical protein
MRRDNSLRSLLHPASLQINGILLCYCFKEQGLSLPLLTYSKKIFASRQLASFCSVLLLAFPSTTINIPYLFYNNNDFFIKKANKLVVFL